MPGSGCGRDSRAVRDGDAIELDVNSRRLHLEVPEDELQRRREHWKPPLNPMKGGYQQLYVERVMQANTGADLDFLTG